LLECRGTGGGLNKAGLKVTKPDHFTTKSGGKHHPTPTNQFPKYNFPPITPKSRFCENHPGMGHKSVKGFKLKK